MTKDTVLSGVLQTEIPQLSKIFVAKVKRSIGLDKCPEFLLEKLLKVSSKIEVKVKVWGAEVIPKSRRSAVSVTLVELSLGVFLVFKFVPFRIGCTLDKIGNDFLLF